MYTVGTPLYHHGAAVPEYLQQVFMEKLKKKKKKSWAMNCNQWRFKQEQRIPSVAKVLTL